MDEETIRKAIEEADRLAAFAAERLEPESNLSRKVSDQVYAGVLAQELGLKL